MLVGVTVRGRLGLLGSRLVVGRMGLDNSNNNNYYYRRIDVVAVGVVVVVGVLTVVGVTVKGRFGFAR
jgi:hypothetical protein